MCLRGASEVHAALFAREPDPRLRPFVIWVPKVRGREAHVPRATLTIPDPRALHFWDGDGLLMNAYQQVLGIAEDAWDVYLLYEAGTRWDGPLPPAPRLWMHQLGTPAKPRVRGVYLDVDRFTRETLGALRSQ